MAPASGALRKEPPLYVPPILLEGDEPVRAEPVASGQKLALGRAPSPGGAPVLNGEDLPEAYGSGRLMLAPRDPHCLYAHWDLTAEQRRSYNQLSEHRHLLVRVHLGSVSGEIVQELHVHPDSRYWFIRVERPGTTYVVELGYYQIDHQWRTVSVSDPAATPGQTGAAPAPARFATFPLALPLPGVTTAVSGTGEPHPKSESRSLSTPPAVFPVAEQPHIAAAGRTPPPQGRITHGGASPQPGVSLSPDPGTSSRPGLPLRIAIARGPAGSPLDLERHGPIHTPVLPGRDLPAEQQRILRELTGWTEVSHEWLGSAELEALLRREAPADRGLPPVAEGEIGLPPAPSESIGAAPTGPEAGFGISSLQGGKQQRGRGFWFNVNAELVVYGATEPGATVTIAGHVIQLRPDGTFTCRFSLPDGCYELPVMATSLDGETRQAVLSFSRRTAYSGEVGASAQDPGLNVPPGDAT